MAFGGRADAALSSEMVKTFLGRGHSRVDTAFMYMDGKSETVIGGMSLPKTGREEAAILVKTVLTRTAFLKWKNQAAAH